MAHGVERFESLVCYCFLVLICCEGAEDSCKISTGAKGDCAKSRKSQPKETQSTPDFNGGWLYHDAETVNSLPERFTGCNLRVSSASEAAELAQKAEPFVLHRSRSSFSAFASRLSKAALESRKPDKVNVQAYTPFSDWSVKRSYDISIGRLLEYEMSRLEVDERVTQRAFPFMPESSLTLLGMEGATTTPPDFVVPGTNTFHHDIYEQELNEVLPFRDYTMQIAIEGPGGGLPFHQHHAFLHEIIYGEKTVIATPPGSPPIFNPRQTVMKWIQTNDPNVSFCTLGPGDMFFASHLWWHAFVSLGESVAIAKIFPRYRGNDKFHEGPLSGLSMRDGVKDVLRNVLRLAEEKRDVSNKKLEKKWESMQKKFKKVFKANAKYKLGFAEYDALASMALFFVDLVKEIPSNLSSKVLVSAQKYANRTLTLNPLWGPAWTRLARIHSLLGESDSVIEACLQEALKLGELSVDISVIGQRPLTAHPEFWQSLYLDFDSSF